MAIIFDSILSDFITISAIALAIGYYFTKKSHSYWKNRGIKYLQPSFPFGNFGRNFLQKISFSYLVKEMYDGTNEPYIGVYTAFKPTLIVRDPELVRSIFIKDFQHFHDRGTFIDEKNDPLSGHLFSLAGEKWKKLRVKLSPVFTSGKLKAMFQTVVDCGEPLQRFMNEVARKEAVIEVRDIAARYTTNIIASTAFGIDINCIDNPDTDFRKYGKKAFTVNWITSIKVVIIVGFPGLQRFLNIKFTSDDIENFMMTLVRDNLEYREKNNIIRKDFFQLLMQLRNTGKIQEDDDKWDTTASIKDEKLKALSFNELAAQAWVFYLAGFETSSTVMSFCLYELAKNQNCQRKVQQEIDEILRKHDNKITYESVSEMQYLECCIDETLRLYPPLGVLQRECTKEYRIPGTEHTIEKGTAILLPALALQMDPKYYPEPEQFKPERFSAENQKSFNEMPYMPFGEGPRICIGSRMGKMQTKVGLIIMLQNYSYHLAGNTKNGIKIEPGSFITAVKGGLELKVTQRIS